MFPGMDRRMMQQAMKKLGMQQEEIPATQVIIRLLDKDLIISNPQVAKVTAMGQETFQVVGEVEEHASDGVSEEAPAAPEEASAISEEDIAVVQEQAKAGRQAAMGALQKHNGDLAAAIVELQGAHK
ncbi:Nascent polypeptide-associated complex protein [Candidatus Woesearchaeota archaeon]|nr:Nascent polypeptide-associated complex protein [Candidatus Woesearchaeota archaeon]